LLKNRVINNSFYFSCQPAEVCEVMPGQALSLLMGA